MKRTVNIMMNDRLISLNAAKDYIDSQKGRPFIGCTVGEAMKIMLDEVPSAQPEQFNPCTVCQEFDCTGCKFRRTK